MMYTAFSVGMLLHGAAAARAPAGAGFRCEFLQAINYYEKDGYRTRKRVGLVVGYQKSGQAYYRNIYPEGEDATTMRWEEHDDVDGAAYYWDTIKDEAQWD